MFEFAIDIKKQFWNVNFIQSWVEKPKNCSQGKIQGTNTKNDLSNKVFVNKASQVLIA